MKEKKYPKYLENNNKIILLNTSFLHYEICLVAKLYLCIANHSFSNSSNIATIMNLQIMKKFFRHFSNMTAAF